MAEQAYRDAVEHLREKVAEEFGFLESERNRVSIVRASAHLLDTVAPAWARVLTTMAAWRNADVAD